VKIDPTQPVEIDGKVFDLVERKAPELTVEDCVKGNPLYFLDNDGTLIRGQFSPENAYMGRPTKTIAEKVLLYGLLCSVAHKLNGDWKPDWSNGAQNKFWLSSVNLGAIQVIPAYTVNDGCPVFKLRELAEQAIRMFAASRFDL
jgi:hypothetical protein